MTFGMFFYGFLILWGIIAVFTITKSTIGGLKVLKIFPDLDRVHVRFVHKWSSCMVEGTSLFKKGAVRNLLHIVVTNEEVWLKTGVIVAGIAAKYRIVQKVPLTNIRNADLMGDYLYVDMIAMDGEPLKIRLYTPQLQQLADLLVPHTQEIRAQVLK